MRAPLEGVGRNFVTGSQNGTQMKKNVAGWTDWLNIRESLNYGNERVPTFVYTIVSCIVVVVVLIRSRLVWRGV